jgi:broad specificity phosphatase PhoE
MSTLLIVRHGQASFGAADYDQLSELGATQSQQLGAYFANHGKAIDAVYCGPAKRHRQTLESMSSAPDLELPDAQYLDGLGEFPAFKLAKMHGKSMQISSFEELTYEWMHGRLDCGELETAEQFSHRVEESFRNIIKNEGRGKTILVVTSGGPTMVAMKSALSLHPSKASDLLWTIVNSSVSEFRFREDSLSLVGFNRIAHLRAEHITYR